MAAVYRAADTVLQRDIALKILYPQYSDDASLVERFKREAVLAASLEHPNIVPVYDVGEYDGMAYIAMKLLSGRTFQDRLQEAGAISIEELIAVLAPVAAALDYAHGRGVVHRDIKPGNIFLSQDADGARPILTDFGIAKQLDAPGLTTTGALIGTPDYMAPEQIAGRPVDARVDIYALGMLAFRALAGRRAFEGSTQDVLLGHLYGRAPLLSEVNGALPRGADDVVGRAIATEPAARYSSAGAFLQALRQVAHGATAATAVGVALVGRPAAATAGASVATAVGTPPPLAAAAQPTRHGAQAAAPTASGAPANAQPRAAGPAPHRPEPVAPRRDVGSGPWLLAVALALVAGGLAVALAFAVRGQANQGGAVPPLPTDTAAPPPSPSAEAPSPTSDGAAVATATVAQATATGEPPSPTPPPATATPQPATAGPPSPAPPSPAPPTATGTATPTPTAATATPTETATVATATPTETATAATVTVVAECDEGLLTGGFGQLYAAQVEVRRGLGCPRETELVGPGSQQFFAGGSMFWWSDRNRDASNDHIFVFKDLEGGLYEEFPPDDVAALGPEPTPPDDPNGPRRGFGRIYFYRTDISTILGEWTSPEYEFKGGTNSAVIQYFERGRMIWTPISNPTGRKSIYVLYNNGTFERYDDAFAG